MTTTNLNDVSINLTTVLSFTTNLVSILFIWYLLSVTYVIYFGLLFSLPFQHSLNWRVTKTPLLGFLVT